MRASLPTVLFVCLALGCGKKGPPLPDMPLAKIAEASAPSSPALQNPREFVLDAAASQIGFVGANFTGEQQGHFSKFSGSAQIEGSDLSKVSANVKIDMDSVQTGADGLTKHLKSADFFDVANHPTATFNSTRIVPGAERGGTHTVSGIFDLRGVKKEITFPATIAVTGDRATLDAKFLLDRQPFGVSHKGATDNLIRDAVVINLALVGVASKTSQ
jgi:polyisoprenoid-binding protein YceI